MELCCRTCGETKPLSDYYKGHMSRDCRIGKCKECVKADVRTNRLVNVDYYREYDRKRSNLPKRVAARAEYAASDSGRESQNRAKRKYSLRPDRRNANVSLGNAVRDGRIVKLDACEYCGSQNRLQGHHPAYDLPLVVTWLCVPCHAALHKEHREIMRKRANAGEAAK